MIGEMDLRTLFVIAFKFRRRAVGVFLVFVGLAIAASVLVPTQYQSTASVLVKIGRELVYRPDIGSAATPLPSIDKDQLMTSNIHIMRSPSIMEDVIKHVGMDRIYPDLAGDEHGPEIMLRIKAAIREVKDALGMVPPTPMHKAVERLDRDLSIAVVQKTGIIDVGFMNPDPVIAAEVANEVVAQFQKRVGEIYDNPDMQFEEQRVDAMRTALGEAESKLNAYRQTHDVYALDNQLSLLLQQRVAIDSKLKDTDSQITQLQGLTSALGAQVAVTPKTVPLYTETERHRAVDDSAAQLLALQLQERQMATRYGNDYPQLAEVRSQIRLAQTSLASQSGQVGSQTRTGLNDIHTALNQSLLQNQAQLKSLVGMRETLAGQLATVDTAVAALSGNQPEVAQLQRDVDQRNDALKTSYDKLVEMRTVEGLNHEKPASFSVYEPAVASDLADRARPVPLLYMLVGITVGLIGALVTLFFSYRMFNGFLTPKQAALRLNRPVLAVVDYDRRLASWGRSMPPDHAALRGGSTEMAV